MLKKILKFIGGVFLLLVLMIAGLLSTMRAHIPDDRFSLQPVAAGPAVFADDGYLIFGATRNTGLLVASILRERGDKVTAFVRPTSDRSELQALDVEFAEGDAMEPDSVKAAFQGRNFRAVLSTIGCLRCDPPIDFLANKHVVDAAVEAGVTRLVLVTTIGAGDSEDAPPWLSTKILARTLPLKTQAEDHLRASGLEYTIIRPGGLRSASGTGNGILTEDIGAFGFIFREDLAELLVACLDDPRTIGKTFAAIDAHRAWPWSAE
jgi:uncharacterized protein YbjT (DUF2867 family)